MDSANCNKRSHPAEEDGHLCCRDEDVDEHDEPTTKKLRLNDESNQRRRDETVHSFKFCEGAQATSSKERSIDRSSPLVPSDSHHLPDEILDRIFSHLSLPELCRGPRGVCRAWQRAVANCDAWKSVDLCRHWRQNLRTLSTSHSSPKILPRRFLTALRKLRIFNFTSKYRERRHERSSSLHPRYNPLTSAINAHKYPRGPSLHVILDDLKALLRDVSIVQSLDLTGVDVEDSSETGRRDDDDEADEISVDDHTTVRVSNPRLPLSALVFEAFAGIKRLDALAVETRNFAGFPYAPSIAAQPWARTLKRLSLTLCPKEQGVQSRSRVDRALNVKIATRSNYHVLGSLQPLVDSCPSLQALAIELSFGSLPKSAEAHVSRPLRRLASRCTFKDLRIGLLCFTHELKLFTGKSARDQAVERLNDFVDSLFEPDPCDGGDQQPACQKCVDCRPFKSLDVFHLVNLVGPNVIDPFPLRLITLKKLICAVPNVEELTVTGFRFHFPAGTGTSLQSLQNVENPFVNFPQRLKYLRFFNRMDKFGEQPLLHVGLVTALSNLKDFHRLEADLPPLCWYGLQPIVKQLTDVEVTGMTWSLATSFLLVIDNVESLAVHTQLSQNAAEILQIATHTLHKLRHLSFYDSGDPIAPIILNSRVIAQTFRHKNWSRLHTLRIETQDFSAEALLNITENCSSLTEFYCAALHANNFFGWSLDAGGDKRALDAFRSLSRLGATLRECRIDVHSRFLFDELDWPSDKLVRIFVDPRTIFKVLRNLTFIYRCNEGNFCYSIAETWTGDLVRAIDFWNERGEMSHYLPDNGVKGNGGGGGDGNGGGRGGENGGDSRDAGNRGERGGGDGGGGGRNGGCSVGGNGGDSGIGGEKGGGGKGGDGGEGNDDDGAVDTRVASSVNGDNEGQNEEGGISSSSRSCLSPDLFSLDGRVPTNNDPAMHINQTADPEVGYRWYGTSIADFRSHFRSLGGGDDWDVDDDDEDADPDYGEWSTHDDYTNEFDDESEIDDDGIDGPSHGNNSRLSDAQRGADRFITARAASRSIARDVAIVANGGVGSNGSSKARASNDGESSRDIPPGCADSASPSNAIENSGRGTVEAPNGAVAGSNVERDNGAQETEPEECSSAVSDVNGAVGDGDEDNFN